MYGLHSFINDDYLLKFSLVLKFLVLRLIQILSIIMNIPNSSEFEFCRVKKVEVPTVFS